MIRLSRWRGAMSKRYTETELEKIIRIGCARIDQAVEQVCAKYEAPQRYSNRWLHDICLEDLFIPNDFWPKRFADLLEQPVTFGCASRREVVQFKASTARSSGILAGPLTRTVQPGESILEAVIDAEEEYTRLNNASPNTVVITGPLFGDDPLVRELKKVGLYSLAARAGRWRSEKPMLMGMRLRRRFEELPCKVTVFYELKGD